MSDPVRKLALLHGRPEQRAAFADALTELQRHTQAEPGARVFKFYRAIDDADDVLLLEIFDSEAAFREHLRAPYARHFFEADLTRSVNAIDLPIAVDRLIQESGQ